MKKGALSTIVNLIITLAFMLAVVMVYQYIIKANAPSTFDVTYPYFEDVSNAHKYNKIDTPTTLVIRKDNKITIGNYNEFDFSKKSITCEKINVSTKIKSLKLLLDPSHGSEEDKGVVIDDKVESELIREFVSAFFNMYSGSFGSVKSTRPLNQDLSDPLSVDDRLVLVTESDMVLGFMASYSENDKRNEIIAYVSSKSMKVNESRYVGCEILNEILSSNAGKYITGGTVVEIDPSLLSRDDPRRMLSTDKIGVYLEIGNLNNKDTLYNLIETASVYKGINNVYK